MKNYNTQQGYIALMSAIIISAILLAITFSVGVSGLYARFNELDNENKLKSFYLAIACVNNQLLRLAADGNDVTTGSIFVGKESCTVTAVYLNTPTTGEVTIETKAQVGQSVTYLRELVDTINLVVVSLEEFDSS